MPPTLVQVLTTLDRARLSKISKLYRFNFDEGKRINKEEQLARHIVERANLRARTTLTDEERSFLDAIARRGGAIKRTGEPRLGTLETRALVISQEDRIVIPRALYLELEPWPEEPQHSMRALFRGLGKAKLRQILARTIKGPLPPPLLLHLEEIWPSLEDGERIALELGRMSPSEKMFFERLRSLGGNAEPGELGATSEGVTPAILALEQRGLLLQTENDGLVIPREVEERCPKHGPTVSADEIPDEPLRAVFSSGPRVEALLISIEARNAGVRDVVGVPKTFVTRMSRTLGSREERVLFLASHARALGFFRLREPLELEGNVASMDLRIFSAWRQGIAWDEGLAVEDLMRNRLANSVRTPTYLARELLLDALLLSPRTWMTFSDLIATMTRDARWPVLEARFSSFNTKVEGAVSLHGTLKKMFDDSLHWMGMVDASVAPSSEATIRLSRTGLRLAQGLGTPGDRPSLFEATTLFLGTSLSIEAALEFGLFGTAGTLHGEPVIKISEDSIRTALVAGHPLSRLEGALRREGLSVSQELEHLLRAFSIPVGTATQVESSAFLFVEQGAARDALLALPNASDLFFSPSPPEGLIVRAGTSESSLRAAVRAARVVLKSPA